MNQTAPATALVDGDNGMGHLVMSRAAETAIALARDAGVSWVGVRKSNHAGTAGIYAEMPVHHGMIGFYAAVANANHMAVWGGAELLLGTNPLGIGVPSGAGPLVLDMATTVVSYGTVKKYALQGLSMPRGLVGRHQDRRAADRSPSARARACCCRSAATRAPVSRSCSDCSPASSTARPSARDVVDFNADDASETNTGHFICAIDIKRFIPLDAFTAEVDRHMGDLHASQAPARLRRHPAAGRAAARSAAPNACATAFRCRTRWRRSSTSWRGRWG